MTHLVVLDSEAVAGLLPEHAKHRRVLSHIQVVADRKRRGRQINAVVPVAVRAEAGWDRSKPRWAFANQVRIVDVALDTDQANAAATIRASTGVSVADAHVGSVVRSSAADRVTVLTSDPLDIRAVAGDRKITIVTL
jgi:hypothetical protein